MNKANESTSRYTIRKDGKIMAQSDIPDCGYSIRELKELDRAGYHLYQDGKRVKIGGRRNG